MASTSDEDPAMVSTISSLSSSLQTTRQKCKRVALDHYALQLRLDSLEERHRAAQERRLLLRLPPQQTKKTRWSRRQLYRQHWWKVHFVLLLGTSILWFHPQCVDWIALIEDESYSGKLLGRHIFQRFASKLQEIPLQDNDNTVLPDGDNNISNSGVIATVINGDGVDGDNPRDGSVAVVNHGSMVEYRRSSGIGKKLKNLVIRSVSRIRLREDLDVTGVYLDQHQRMSRKKKYAEL